MTAIAAPTAPPRRSLAAALSWVTTPLLPEDYLSLVNPLWSTRELRGRVEAVVYETLDAATIVIRPGRSWSAQRAGQYVRVGVEINGVRHWRTYSLTSPPERADGRITITVKATPGGFVSNHLVRATKPGTIVHLAGPNGDFVLHESTPARILFVTAGSGITPIMGMLRSLDARRAMPDVVLVHSSPAARDVIFGAELRALAARTPSFRFVERHTQTDGVLAIQNLDSVCTDWRERESWVCGPAAMLDDAERHWGSAGLAARLHVERFRPVTPVFNDGAGGTVRFTLTGREVEVGAATPILDAGENAGVLMPSGCRMGICHSCVVTLRCGRVRDLRTGEIHGDEGDLVQTCVSAPAGDVAIEL